MAYVRKKKTKGREYYQLVEGRRENGKVRQKVLVHLGDCPSVEKALWWWPGRILKLRKVAHEVRVGARRTLRLMRKGLSEGAAEREFVLRFVDEGGHMRRRKYRPHAIKDAYYRLEIDDYNRLPGDLYFTWQYEYWQKMDHVENLERKARELEERYFKLYALCVGDLRDAQRLLRDRYRRLRRGQKRRSRWLAARDAERRRATGVALLEAAAKTNPILGLQAHLHGYEIPADE